MMALFSSHSEDQHQSSSQENRPQSSEQEQISSKSLAPDAEEVPQEASKAVENSDVDAPVNDKSGSSSTAKKRKYYHCFLMNKTTGQPCPGTRISSRDIYKHLKTKLHYGPTFSSTTCGGEVPPQVAACAGSIECEHCRRNLASAHEAGSCADRELDGEVSGQQSLIKSSHQQSGSKHSDLRTDQQQKAAPSKYPFHLAPELSDVSTFLKGISTSKTVYPHSGADVAL